MKRLNELTAAEEAHALGLTYGGYGGWVNKAREVVAKTIDGKLVKVEDGEEGGEGVDLGRLTIFDFDDGVLETDKTKAPRFLGKFDSILHALRNKGGDLVFIVPRGTERAVADYLRKAGMQAGPKIVNLPANEPNQRRDFVKKKIDQGYSNIHYFGRSKKDNAAVESLRATLNKVEHLSIKTHLLTSKGQFKGPDSKPEKPVELDADKR